MSSVPLAVTGASLDGVDVGLRVADGRIAELGPSVAAAPGDRILDGAGRAIFPGLVNGHTHAGMTLFRGYADDLPLVEWLQEHIWPAEARIDADDVYWGTRLACAEMIRTGTTRFWDMYWQPGAVARAVTDAGIGAVVGAPLIDGGGSGDVHAVRAATESALAELEDAGAGISPALAPHAIYTVSNASLEWIAAESEALGLPIHIHVSETEQEVKECLEANGVRPVELLDRLGVLGPRTLLAHSVWLDERERELIAASGATVVTNPVANMKLAIGSTFDLPAASRLGIPVGLGTDSAGSNNSLDLLADAKHLALVQKHRAADAGVATAAEILSIATGAAAPLLGGSPLAVGERADFILVRSDGPELSLGSFEAGLVYSASGAVVDATVVAGELLMEGGVVAGVAEVVERARERAVRIGLR